MRACRGVGVYEFERCRPPIAPNAYVDEDAKVMGEGGDNVNLRFALVPGG